jgi:hypothetical protein
MVACLVIGSGSAGIACADALLEAARDLITLDVGRECEPDRMQIVRVHEPDTTRKIERNLGLCSSLSEKSAQVSTPAYCGFERGPLERARSPLCFIRSAPQ